MTVIRPSNISGITSITALANGINFYNSSGGPAQVNIGSGITINSSGISAGIITATTLNSSKFNVNNTLPTTVSYASSFRVAGQETAPQEISFSNDGKTMYVLGNTGDDITWYNLSTPWDITTATHVSQFSVAGQEAGPVGLYFKPDGTKFYVVGTTTNDDVYQYSCRTPWDLTTASYDSVSYNVVEDSNPRGVEFKPDGTRMYVVGATNDRIYQYSLSTPWDVSTVSYGSSFSVVGQESTPEGIRFSLDGTKLLLTGSNGDDINYYTLSTPWDITTTSFVGIITTVGVAPFGETVPSGLYWKPDGTRLYLTGTTVDAVWQFNMTSDADLEVTGTLDVYGNTNVYQDLNIYGGISGSVLASVSDIAGITTVGVATSGTSAITLIGSGSASSISNGDYVTGVGVVPGTTVSSGGGTVSLTLSQNVVGYSTATNPLTFYSPNKIVTPASIGGQLCRAWVNFNGTGTVAIRASYNVSSITDNGVGRYTVNFTTAMVDANYSAHISGRKADDNDDGNFIATTGTNTTRVPSATSCPISTSYTSLTSIDFPSVYVAIFR